MTSDLVRRAWAVRGEELVRFFRDILWFASLPGSEESMARRVAEEMERLGLEDARTDGWGNALARVPGEGPRLMLCAHIDVVSPGEETAWSRPPFGGSLREGRIVGRGASDTKSSVACQVYAAAVLKEAGILRSDLTLAQVVMEEVGGVGVQGLLRDGPAPDAALIGEPSDGTLRIGHRGRVQVEVTFRGKAFHAAVTGAGANPHWAEAAFLARLRGLPLASDDTFGRITIEPTIVHSDNDSPNVVPETLHLVLDCRTLPGYPEEDLLEALRALLEESTGDGVSYTMQVPRLTWTTWTGRTWEMDHVMPAFATDPSDPLVEAAATAVRGVTGVNEAPGPWRFATDGGHLSAAGARVVGYGPGRQERAHTVDEYLTVDELREGFEATLAAVIAMDEQLHEEER